MKMAVTQKGYDLRDLVEMLAEPRSRRDRDAILLAIKALRRDDRDSAAEMAHLMGAANAGQTTG